LPVAFLLVVLATTAVAISMFFSRLTGYAEPVGVREHVPGKLT